MRISLVSFHRMVFIRPKRPKMALQALAVLTFLSLIRGSAAAAPATRLELTLDHCAIEACPPTNPVRPPVVSSGETFSIYAIAVDSTGRDMTYRGTISFSSSDPAAELPLPYTFTASDNGGRGFTVVLRTVGQQTITVRDVSGGLSEGTLSLTVTGPTVPTGIPALSGGMMFLLAILLGSIGTWLCQSTR
jgi:hypothetical protein